MIGVRDEIDQQGFRYREELLPYPGAPHLPSRLVNISTNSKFSILNILFLFF